MKSKKEIKVTAPRDYWRNIENQRHFMNDLAKKLHIKSHEGWYNITCQTLLRYGGRSLYRIYRGSLVKLLREVYPKVNWNNHEFRKVPQDHWESVENQRLFMAHLAKKLNIKSTEGWYNVTRNVIEGNGGAGLLESRYKGSSVVQLLRNCYPEVDWDIRKFKCLPRGHWRDFSQQRKLMDEIRNKLNIQHPTEWCDITTTDIADHGGLSLVNGCYNGSLTKLLSTIYPEYKEMCRQFVNQVMLDFNLNKVEDVLHVSIEYPISLSLLLNKSLTQPRHLNYRNSQLMKQHHYAISTLIDNCFPELQLKIPKKEHAPPKYWQDISNHRKFLDELALKLNVKSANDWHLISAHEVRKHGGSTLLRHYGSIVKAAYLLLPKENNIVQPLKAPTYRADLHSRLKSIFEEYSIETNASYDDFVYSSNTSFRVDLLIPNLALGLVYHEAHLGDNNNNNNPTFIAKKEALHNLGINLASIPFLDAKPIASLLSYLRSIRPDLETMLPQTYVLNATPNKKIFMLHYEYPRQMNPTNWWMTEKYNGVRCMWDGNQFVRQNGRVVQVPYHIRDTFPKEVTLDGRWCGKDIIDSNDKSAEILMQRGSIDWTQMKFTVIDSPNQRGLLEDRIEYLNKTFERHPFISIATHIQCESHDHFRQFCNNVLMRGGDTVLLRQPNSLYTPGRSSSMYRYKPVMDTDVLIVEVHNRHMWQCITKSNITFISPAIATLSDKIKPPVVATVTHCGFAARNGRPRRPRITDIKLDVSTDGFINE